MALVGMDFGVALSWEWNVCWRWAELGVESKAGLPRITTLKCRKTISKDSHERRDAIRMSGGTPMGRNAAVKLEPAGSSEAGDRSEYDGEDPQPLGGGGNVADDSGRGLMCTCAETFAALLIQRALRRLAEPHRHRFRPDVRA